MAINRLKIHYMIKYKFLYYDVVQFKHVCMYVCDEYRHVYIIIRTVI